jgi:hypothetical protein
MSGCAGLRADLVEVEQFHVGVLPDEARRLPGHEPDLGLCLGQRGENVQPRLYAALVVQEPVQFRRPPQVSIEDGVDKVGTHTRPP